MPRLEQITADHAAAILRFEHDNRDYFAASISDRGDDFFDQFDARYRDSLAEQESGECAFFVLVDDDGEVLGRFNLYDLHECTARVGYRVAEQVAGRGVATAAVRRLCAVAAALGLESLVAATSDDNVASQQVLEKSGFKRLGTAGPDELGGKHGIRYRRDLAATTSPAAPAPAPPATGTGPDRSP